MLGDAGLEVAAAGVSLRWVAYCPGHVAAVIDVEIVMRASGYVIADQEIHLWTFDEAGLVSAFRHVVDTAKHIEAARSAVTA